MVLESIYNPEFPDTSHFRSGRGCQLVLRRIKEEWGISRWFLEFDIRKCFHTINRHRLIPIFKEEIDDPKFFYPFRKGNQKTKGVFPPSSSLAAFLNKPSSLFCAAFLIEATGLTPKAELYGRERCNNNWAMRDLIKYCKRKGLPIELGGDAILVIKTYHRNTKTYRPLPTIRPEPLGRLRRINNNSCTEYGRIPRYGHSGSPSEDDPPKSSLDWIYSVWITSKKSFLFEYLSSAGILLSLSKPGRRGLPTATGEPSLWFTPSLPGTTCQRNKEEEGSVDLAQFLDTRTQSSPFFANSFS
ncbi:hypothetical protein QYF36_008605 [Acer negundo]|nr:hypothetical protein QYF36_008605 [Acer negundo]